MDKTKENEMTLELATVKEHDARVLFIQGGLDPVLDWIEETALAQPVDLMSKKGRAVITSTAYSVARCKSIIDTKGKELNAELKKETKAVDDKRRAARDRCELIQAKVKQPLDDWLAEQAAKKAAFELEQAIDKAWDEAHEYAELLELRAKAEAEEKAREAKEAKKQAAKEAKEAKAREKREALEQLGRERLQGLLAFECKTYTQEELAKLGKAQYSAVWTDAKVLYNEVIADAAAQKAKAAAQKAKADAQKAKADAEAEKVKAQKQAVAAKKKADADKAKAVEYAKQEERKRQAKEAADAKVRADAERKAKEQAEARKDHRENVEAEAEAAIISALVDDGVSVGEAEIFAAVITEAIKIDRIPHVRIDYSV